MDRAAEECLRAPVDGACERFADDHFLVSKLTQGDNAAWSWLFDEVVYVLFRANIRGIRDICLRNAVTETAVASRLYRTLSREDFKPLRSFQFKCAFRSWIYWYVWDAAQGALREVVGKHDREVSDSEVLESLTDTKAPSSEKSLERRETADAMNGMLARLWKENPSRAMILLLRGDLGLSSKEVGAFLNKEPSNVDQIFHRAQSAMRKIRDAEEER
jgi:RNA polymerase sigma factor (sigma-70 family)